MNQELHTLQGIAFNTAPSAGEDIRQVARMAAVVIAQSIGGIPKDLCATSCDKAIIDPAVSWEYATHWPACCDEAALTAFPNQAGGDNNCTALGPSSK